MLQETDRLAIYWDAFKTGYGNKAAIILNLDNQEVYHTEAFDQMMERLSECQNGKLNLEWQESKIVDLYGYDIGILIRFNQFEENSNTFQANLWDFNHKMPFSIN